MLGKLHVKALAGQFDGIALQRAPHPDGFLEDLQVGTAVAGELPQYVRVCEFDRGHVLARLNLFPPAPA